jgi:DNA-binding CsgD family transcriptional regulator
LIKGDSHTVEIELQVPSESGVILGLTGSLVRDELASPAAITFVITDVTDRNDLERMLVAKAASAGKLLASLTPREREILQFLSEAGSAPQMAEKLSVSVRTVESHLANAYRKLGVRTREDAISEFARLNAVLAGVNLEDLEGIAIVEDV